MEKFVYVFSEADRDTLLSLGFTLMKSDDLQHTYVFENKDILNFETSKMRMVFSDTLTY